jgi:hypothetical protein
MSVSGTWFWDKHLIQRYFMTNWPLYLEEELRVQRFSGCVRDNYPQRATHAGRDFKNRLLL